MLYNIWTYIKAHMYVCDGTKFTFSRSYRKAWKHKRQKERIHHHHCSWLKNKSNHRQSLSLSHTYSVSFPSLSSPVWSFSWSLSAAMTGSPSRPGDPPETPCRRCGSNKSDSNFKAAFTPYKLTTLTVFKFSSSVHTWVLCVAPGRPCPPHPAAWTKLLLPLCWETGASWEIYLLPRL